MLPLVLVALVALLTGYAFAADAAPVTGGGFAWLFLGLGGGVGAFLKSWLSPDEFTFDKKSIQAIIVGLGVGMFWQDYSPFPFDPSMPIPKQVAAITIIGAFSGDLFTDILKRFTGQGSVK